ncbi:MAG: DNA polymerase III subunit delta [Pseudohongiellaceae bacterium]
MQVKQEQVLSQLNNKIPSLIWVAGDETLLVQESCDEIRKFAQGQGFSEREVYTVQGSFDWNILLESANSLSLFAEKKLIDLRLNSAKLDDAGKKALHSYLEDPSPDNLLLISSPKIEKATTKTKWFKQIDAQAFVVVIWPIYLKDLAAWVKQRLKRYGLEADEHAIEILCQRTEGNLLATAQEIDKLSILTEKKELETNMVARVVADNARFNVFTLIDAALGGNTARALNILYHLKAESEDSLKILNFICRELRSLCKMAMMIEDGQSINAAMQSEHIWPNKMGSLSTALNNHSLMQLQAFLNDASLIDQSVKGLNKLNTWDELSRLILALSSNKLSLSA